MLTPVEDYQLTLKIEMMKERGSEILSRIYRYQDEKRIKFNEESNSWILMSDDLSELINTKIYLVESFDELERYNVHMNGLEQLLDSIKH